jgi:hypothetical protein
MSAAGAMTSPGRRFGGIAACVVVAGAVAACSGGAPPPVLDVPSASSSTLPPPPPPPASAAATAPRTQNWVDLTVGDCVASIPAVEQGEVTVTMADCAAPHRAEVYLLTPIAVNTAVTDTANQKCAAGLGPYAGPAAGEYAVTYLIDSRQDRTDNNPLPSTVICLLQSADGQPLTGSARR